MDTIIAHLLIAAVGLFSLALVAVSARARHAVQAPRRRAPARSAQAGAVPESLFRGRA